MDARRKATAENVNAKNRNNKALEDNSSQSAAIEYRSEQQQYQTCPSAMHTATVNDREKYMNKTTKKKKKISVEFVTYVNNGDESIKLQ